MRVLVTNDDGITSPGLTLLAEVALEAGHDVIVAAPNREYSGFSAALSGEDVDGELSTSEGRPPGLSAEVESTAVHASPGLIAYAAGLGAFGPRPDLLISGVNLGPNVGTAVVHSGTVGAALSAAAQGIPAMATSIDSARPRHWETARLVVAEAFAWLTSHPQDGRVLNINIPDVAPDDLLGLRTAALATFGGVPDTVDLRVRQLLFGAVANEEWSFDEDTDAHYLASGWATASLLRATTHDEDEATLPTFTREDMLRRSVTS